MNQYYSETARKALARKIAAESMVLLENKNSGLPLAQGFAAFFGRACYDPNISGSGSGDAGRNKSISALPYVCMEAGLFPVDALNHYYENIFSEIHKTDPLTELLASGTDLVASGMIYEIFGQYNSQPEEISVPKELITQAAKETDTAIYMLGRNTGGEECDRRIENDFLLLDSEKQLLANICAAFSNVVLLLNINGIIDLSWISDYPAIRSVLFVGLPGEMGMYAISDLLTGAKSPSGKLAFTIAKHYSDYPSAHDFSFNKEAPDSILEYQNYGLDAAANGSKGFSKSPVTVYREGIYTGYRYFDSFGKEVLYPFGYGLSYADFVISGCQVKKQTDGICIKAQVKNTSQNFSGKEVIQIYVSKPHSELEQPYQIYCGCYKTSSLAPFSSELASVSISWRTFASYHEKKAAWILEAGSYIIRIGTSSRNTQIAAVLNLAETVIYEQVQHALPLREENIGKIDFFSSDNFTSIGYENEEEELARADVITLYAKDITLPIPCTASGVSVTTPVTSTLSDVENKRVSMSEFLSQMSVEELAVLTNGYGPGLPFGGIGSSSPPTIQYPNGTDIAANTHPSGTNGYISPALDKYGIYSAYYKDGPAGVGYTTWATGMLLACSFDTELFYEFGAACGCEADLLEVDSWLAPALNLQRNPLGGRNFEYFSEDPLAAGFCGLFICRGVSENCNTTICPKHFAVNEQETYRRGNIRKNYDAVDSILTERTAREIYLFPFEMVIKTGTVRTLMTAFNKINGTFSAGNYDLCTQILRNEWGYEGVVVTDWGDMDIVVDGADAVAAGNDVIMPGGPPVITQVLKGYEEGRVTRAQLLTAVSHLMHFVMDSQSYQKQLEKAGGGNP